MAHLQEVHKELYIAAMMEIEATSDVSTLMERNAAVKTMLQDKQKEVDALDRSRMAARRRAEEAYRPLVALIAESDSDPALKEFLQSISTTATPTEMEDEISAEEARLELTHEGNGAVIREYEQRQKRVDALKATLEEGKGAFDEQAEHIRAIREKWEPELDKLVEKISKSFEYNMAQINCAGEVAVFKDENDFDSWAIQILVKFRYVRQRLARLALSCNYSPLPSLPSMFLSPILQYRFTLPFLLYILSVPNAGCRFFCLQFRFPSQASKLTIAIQRVRNPYPTRQSSPIGR